MKNRLNIVAAAGLVLGGIFGILGSVVAAPHLRAIFWAIDGAGLVVATSLLTVKFFRQSNDIAAAGFLVFAIGEGVMLSGTALTLEAAAASFAAGTALWSAALLLISVPRGFALWTRLVGILAAILFAIVSARLFWGEPLTAISRPLPFFAYPFLVLTFVGWIWALLRES